MKNVLSINDMELGYFWHCFGTERHRADEDTVVDLLEVSRTKVLPINTHRLGSDQKRDALEHGFDGVSYDALSERVDTGTLVKMLNINLRTSTQAAVEVAKLAHEMTGERILKLEVLDDKFRQSNDQFVIDAAEELIGWNPDLIVLPLLSNNLESAKRAVSVGCPLLRVMGSPISSHNGIADLHTFKQITALEVPVVLDGGVGTPEHISEAANSGASGVLVNSVLFDSPKPPVEVMKAMRLAADQAFGGVPLGTRGDNRIRIRFDSQG